MTLAEQLVEAEAAYHQLMTGRSVVEVTDQNGERMRYTAVNAALLKQYILDLKGQLSTDPNLSIAPMSVWGRG